MNPARLSLLLAVLCCCAATPARAQFFGLSEIRGGVTLADIDTGNVDTSFMTRPESISTANVELLLDLFPLDMLGFLGEIRPHLGANFGFNGGTAEPQLYAGLSWTVTVAPTPVFIELGAGAAVNAGEVAMVFDSASMGCIAELRGSASLGFNLTPNVRLMATAEHFWPAALCGGAGRESTNLGARVGFKF